MSSPATAVMQPNAPVDPAESLFEPTGNLEKDYCAYCEIEGCSEHDEIIESIVMEETPSEECKVRTTLFVRNLDHCLNKRDMSPLTNAIPHCSNIFSLRFSSCGITDHAYRLLVDAVYRSPSVYSVQVDFNPGALFKDPTVKKDKVIEYLLWPQHARGGNLQSDEQQASDKKGADKKKTAAKTSLPAAVPEASKTPIPVPPGWHSMLLTPIQDLSLRGNSISDKQAASIFAACEGHLDLQSLSLWGNLISDASAQNIANMLRRNRRLTALNLGSNKLTDAGARAIAEALLTADVTPEEHLAHRNVVKTAHVGVMPDDAPTYPSYVELRAMAVGETDPKKDKKPPSKSKSDAVERPKGPWDCDCVRLDKSGKVRVPGNQSLWYINLAANSAITDEGVRAFVSALASAPPVMEALGPEDEPQRHISGAPLEHVLVGNDRTSEGVLCDLQGALEEYAKSRQPPAPSEVDATAPAKK